MALEVSVRNVQKITSGTWEVILMLKIGSVNDATSSDPNGDKKFLQQLPPHLRRLGEHFLIDVRKQFKGELQFRPKSRRYVESPDNFWTVKPQPRDKSLRITVRGTPSYFPKSRSIPLVLDMNGYSSFKVNSLKQIDEAISTLMQAKKKL